MSCAYRGQKRIPDPIELESIVVEPENCEKKYQFHNCLNWSKHYLILSRKIDTGQVHPWNSQRNGAELGQSGAYKCQTHKATYFPPSFNQDKHTSWYTSYLHSPTYIKQPSVLPAYVTPTFMWSSTPVVILHFVF